MSINSFERILQDGILAAKNGNRQVAESLLNQAIQLNPSDARPYLWLSATTDDPREQIEYLEHAVSLKPSNAAARRGLALLKGKLDPQRILPEGAGVAPRRPDEPQEAGTRSFLCEKCGGRMSFNAENGRFACEYCGYEPLPEPVAPPPGTAFGDDFRASSFAERAEQALDFTLPTEQGHRWAEGQYSLACERCGAVSLLPAVQKSIRCAYCGSNQIVEPEEPPAVIDPQVILPIQIDGKKAAAAVKAWLRQGLFTPDDLLSQVKGLKLRPVYYSAWTFDGTIEARWTCEVKHGSGASARWETRSGEDARFFDDILVPGVKAMPGSELASIEPFDLRQGVEFTPEYLAGYTTLIYDRPLADASLLAREKVAREFRREAEARAEPGREKRGFAMSPGKWSGMTYKHVLLPIWTGVFNYRGQTYRILVNGQTGKVGGVKPVDHLKIVLLGLVILIVIAALGALAYILLS